MTKTELILNAANGAVFTKTGRYLSDVETTIIVGAIADQTYEQIAADSGYSINYLKRDIGPKLWRFLSEALGEKVSKTNFQQALNRYQSPVESAPPAAELPASPSAKQPYIDWGEAPDVSFFVGRAHELATLSHWILQDNSRLVGLLGMGGIGKTTLAAKLVQQLQDNFEIVVWRSLRNAPSLETLLTQWMPLLSYQQDVRPRLDALLQHLRAHKCLLVLDNLETILHPQPLGSFRTGYEDYEQLLQMVGETPHQSCLIITSREKPEVLAIQEGAALAVRSQIVPGMETEATALMTAKGLAGSTADCQTLIATYGGNPLALKIAATSIQDLFDGNINLFLEQDTPLFNGVRTLLAKQFARLSALENTLMYWLAINREWTTVTELHEDVVPPVSKGRILDALEALCRRNLLEKQKGRYTQQPVIMEYVCECLIEQIVSELTTTDVDLLTRHALVKTTVVEYVRDSQQQLLLDPIAQAFSRVCTPLSALEQQIRHLLARLRKLGLQDSGYGGGNVINICHHLGIHLANFDFSNLKIWHACLQQVELHDINFAHADLTKSLFTETFSNILSVAFSPDNQLLASSDTQGNIYLREMPYGQMKDVYSAHLTWIWKVVFSPDGRQLASGSYDGMVKIWDVATGRCVNSLNHGPPVSYIAWSPDGTQVASVGLGPCFNIWDVETGALVNVLDINAPRLAIVAWGQCRTSSGETCSLLVCPDGDRRILLWDATSGKQLRALSGHTALVWSVALNRDGTLLASSAQDGTIKIWDLVTDECIQTLHSHWGIAWSLTFSQDGHQLAASCQNAAVELWETATGELLKVFQGHISNVWSAAFNQTGDILVSGGDDQAIKLWNTKTAECLQTWQGYSLAIWDISSIGPYLAAAYQDGTIRLWESATGICRHTIQAHSSLIWAIASSPNGQILASASQDKAVKLFNRETAQCVLTFEEHLNLVLAVAWNSSGKKLASASVDSTVKIWEADTGKCHHTLNHQFIVNSVDWHETDDILASGVQVGLIYIWDGRTGECLQTCKGHTGTIYTLAFAPATVADLMGCQHLLASSSDDGLVMHGALNLWDWRSGTCLKTLEHPAQIWSIDWHPDGRWLASASQDGTV
ncbi:MAG: NB-ARC domain-containing protein, partial [Cyanobacteria bacterium P01_H01_bin.58]